MATTNTTNVNFVKVMNKSQYDDLTKVDGTIYFVDSEKKIYLDGKGYGFSGSGDLTADMLSNFFDIVTESMETSVVGLEQSIVGNKIFLYAFLKVLSMQGMDNISQGSENLLKVGFEADIEHTPGVYVSSSDVKAIADSQISSTVISKKGVANGFAELDADGTVPSNQLPSYVDDVVEVANESSLPTTGETGKIYVTLDDNITWRWTGSIYVEISKSLALGETSSTAYYGNKGKIAYEHALIDTGNPHKVTKADVELGLVSNYAIASKAEAEDGTVANRYMTPLRTKEAIDKLAPKLTWTVVA